MVVINAHEEITNESGKLIELVIYDAYCSISCRILYIRYRRILRESEINCTLKGFNFNFVATVNIDSHRRVGKPVLLAVEHLLDLFAVGDIEVAHILRHVLDAVYPLPVLVGRRVELGRHRSAPGSLQFVGKPRYVADIETVRRAFDVISFALLHLCVHCNKNVQK